MFLIIGLILGVLWGFGMGYGYRMDGAIYLVLVASLVMLFLGLRRWWNGPILN
jgi:hypothetical protein